MDKRTLQDLLYHKADECRKQAYYYSLAANTDKMNYEIGRAVGLEETAGLIENLVSDKDLWNKESVNHLCPEKGEGFTRCCSKPPFELPNKDRLVFNPEHVTCKGI